MAGKARMGRFRKVDTRIWGDAKFRSLSDPPSGATAFLFLLTHPHMTSLGAMRATMAGLAAERGWPETAWRTACQPALAQGMVEVDEKASYVGLPNFIKYNPPESPSVVQSWVKVLDLVPECPLRALQLQRIKAFITVYGRAWRTAWPTACEAACLQGVPHPEPDPEPDPEPEIRQEIVAGSSDEKRQADPSSGNHQPVWPEDMKDVREALEKLEVLEFFNDPLYWRRIDAATAHSKVAYLDELGKCVIHFAGEGGASCPTTKRGWKKAYTTWIKRNLNWETIREARKGFDDSRAKGS